MSWLNKDLEEAKSSIQSRSSWSDETGLAPGHVPSDIDIPAILCKSYDKDETFQWQMRRFFKDRDAHQFFYMRHKAVENLNPGEGNDASVDIHRGRRRLLQDLLEEAKTTTSVSSDESDLSVGVLWNVIPARKSSYNEIDEWRMQRFYDNRDTHDSLLKRNKGVGKYLKNPCEGNDPLDVIQCGRRRVLEDILKANYVPKVNQFPLEKIHFDRYTFKRLDDIICDTLEETLEEFVEFAYGLEFDYRKLQKAMYLEFEKRSWKYVWNELVENQALRGEDQSRDDLCLSIQGKIKKEFQSLYGPVDLDHQGTQIYFRHFSTYLMARAVDLKEMMAFYQNAVATDGELGARLRLLRKLQIQTKIEDELVESIERREIYDINPFTNPLHLDWFLFQRHPTLGQDNISIRHTALDGLVEFNFRREPGTLNLCGYWPSLFDLRVFKTVPLSKNLLQDEKETKVVYNESDEDEDKRDSLEKILTREEKKLNWNALLTTMMTGIARNPMGMRLEEFMAKVKGNRYLKDKPVCPKYTELEIVEKLPDVFLTRETQKVQKKDPNHRNIILFPTYLKGILPDNLDEGLFYKIWKRIIFLAEIGNEKKIALNLIEKTYSEYFNVKISFRYWGFGDAEAFCLWCKQRWDERDGERVRFIDSLYDAKVKYLEVIDEDD